MFRLGVKTPGQLLFWLPHWHVHRDRITTFAQAREGEQAFFLARITNVYIFVRGRLHIIKLQLADGTGRAFLYWFNRPYLIKEYKVGRPLAICEVPERTNAGLRFSGKAGTCELLTDEDVKRIEDGETLVFYRTTTVINQARAREIAEQGLRAGLPSLVDPLPEAVRAKFNLTGLHEALRQAHRPATWAEWEQSRRRLVFEQLYLLQVQLGLSRIAISQIRKQRQYTLNGAKLGKVLSNLPFTLTGAQRRTIEDLKSDLALAYPMNRLLQGDVGSGKTVVAAAAVAAAADSGYQSVVMAPTEILAEQHFHTFRRLFELAGIRVGLLVSGQTKTEKKQLHAGLTGGYFDLVVGTHALIEPDVEIPRLGLVVMDERHKFGVRQRAKLEAKGKHPDLLMMTATPLPRALILTQYGDTTLSLLDEMPPGRGGITTAWMHGAAQRAGAYKFVADRLAQGEQAFAVFPLVEESEHMELRNATKEFERLKHVFPRFRLGLIHGQMATGEKEAVMHSFTSGEIALLVSTTVVEVGIDMPDATVMLIEHANRFGLAQLHQLRGRVGRGPKPSSCFLVTTGQITAEARQRLTVMVKTLSGFELADKDLKLRGPGELFGVKQHGTLDVEYLDLLLDVAELEAARREAEALLKRDPKLSTPEGKRLRQALSTRLADTWGLIRAS